MTMFSGVNGPFIVSPSKVSRRNVLQSEQDGGLSFVYRMTQP